MLILILYGYTIVTCALLYILLMGQTNFHKDGCVGALNRMLTTIPKQFCTGLVSGLCGEKGTNFFKRAEKYLCFQRNPVLQIVYLSLNAANVFLFFLTLFHMIPNVLVPSYHKSLSIGLVVVSYIAYWKACFSNPGVIDSKSQSKFADSYTSDNVLYFEGRKCPTCGIIKPPRSKHCIVTDQCVARFDHFCGWLNNDVGELNYRWFHLFLITNFVTCFYGVYLYSMCLYSVVVENDLMNAVFMTPSGEKIQASLPIVIQYMLGSHLLPMAQTFFLLAIGLMLLGFWGYHLYLTITNTTTNETFKWDDVKKLHNILKSHRKTASNPEDVTPLYHKLYDADDEDKKKKKVDKQQKKKSDTIDKQWRLKQLQVINENIKKGNHSLPNAYDRGIFKNIVEVIFPPATATQKSKFQ